MSASHLSIVRRLSIVFLLGTLLTLLSGALSGVPSAGATTASAVSGYQVVYGPTTASNSLSPKTARAVCPPGKRVIGGGGAVYQPGVGYVRRMALTELRPVFRYDGTSDAYLATAAETPPEPLKTGSWRRTLYVPTRCRVCSWSRTQPARPRLPCRLRLPGVPGSSARAGGSAPPRGESFSRRHDRLIPATLPASGLMRFPVATHVSCRVILAHPQLP
jgi:hypothetical protein